MRNRFTRRAALAALLAVIGAGCSPGERQVEQAIERELPRLVGPAQSYAVDVEGLQGTRGAERVTVTGRRVQPEGAPVLDQVVVILRGVRYNAARRELEAVESANLFARLLATDLSAYLDTRPGLSAVAVRLEPPDAAGVRARPELGQIAVPAGATVETSGRLVARGPRVAYEVAEVRAAGVPLPAVAARRLSEAINPVVDLSALPLALQVTEVRMEGAAILLRAVGRYQR